MIVSLLAFYLAWNLGANDVANAMGTSVGSGAVSLRQALILAGVLEFFGAVLFGRQVTVTLTTGVVDPEQFSSEVFLLGMVSVLLSCGLWLRISTACGCPVASSHAIVGAIAGFSWVAGGNQVLNWQLLGWIGITWIITPVVSGAIAAGLYHLLRYWILQQDDPVQQLGEWLPWLPSSVSTAQELSRLMGWLSHSG